MTGRKLGFPTRPISGGEHDSWEPGNAAWWRIYHRDPRTTDARHRRINGPRARFDHHRPDAGGKPRDDPDDRGITYLAEDLKTAGYEAFWDDNPDGNARVCPRHYVAQLVPMEPIPLLSLHDDGALAIGALPVLATGDAQEIDRELTQAWGRAIYEDLKEVGIAYPSAHNFGRCIALFETAPQLDLVRIRSKPLDAPLQSPGLWRKFKTAYTKTGKRRVIPISSAACPRCQEQGLPVIAARY